jgi:uncharacterized protein YaiI (UPF0178 family)
LPKNQPIIYVDADACPVKAEILKISDRSGVVATFVANGGLRPSRDPLVRHVIVPQGADAADDWIVENVTDADIVITADIPLAHRAVGKGANVLGPTGRPFTADSIGMALAMRDLKQDLRESGAISGHNPGFTQKDRYRFTDALAQAVQKALRDSQS